MKDLENLIRTIPDYPKPGIMFRDITTLLGDPKGLKKAIHKMAEPFEDAKVDAIGAIKEHRMRCTSRELGGTRYQRPVGRNAVGRRVFAGGANGAWHGRANEFRAADHALRVARWHVDRDDRPALSGNVAGDVLVRFGGQDFVGVVERLGWRLGGHSRRT